MLFSRLKYVVNFVHYSIFENVALCRPANEIYRNSFLKDVKEKGLF